MTTTARRLPAYARELVAKRRRGLAPVRDLCITTDWRLGKTWPWRVVVAADDDPATLDFSVVAGLSCLLLGHDQERMDAVARAVIECGPRRLIGARFGGKTINVYLPDQVLDCAA
jgi:hypothetical protein